jgi:hypothetical protein
LGRPAATVRSSHDIPVRISIQTAAAPAAKDSMHMADLERIEERLNTLERSAGRYRRLSAVLALALVAIVVSAAMPGSSDIVRARRFEVVNDKGNVVFVADADNSGGRLVIRRNANKGGVTLFTNDLGGAVGILNGDDKVVVRQGISDKGGLLALTNNAEKLVVLAAANDSSDGAVIVYNRNGRPIWNAR